MSRIYLQENVLVGKRVCPDDWFLAMCRSSVSKNCDKYTPLSPSIVYLISIWFYWLYHIDCLLLYWRCPFGWHARRFASREGRWIGLLNDWPTDPVLLNRQVQVQDGICFTIDTILIVFRCKYIKSLCVLKSMKQISDWIKCSTKHHHGRHLILMNWFLDWRLSGCNTREAWVLNLKNAI